MYSSAARMCVGKWGRCGGALGLIVCICLTPAWLAAPRCLGQHDLTDRTAEVRDALESAAVILQEGHPRAALELLDAVEAKEPRNPWLWFYRGCAWLQLRSPYAAMNALDTAADILHDLGNPAPDLLARIRQVRAGARRQVFNVSFNLGMAYDSNVSYLGDVGTLDTPAGRGDMRYGLGLRLDLAPIADQRQALTAGTRIRTAWHFSVEQFNYQGYGSYLRYTRYLGDRWELAGRYDYDMELLGNDAFLSTHTLTASLTFRPKPSTARFRPTYTTIHYAFAAQEFFYDVDPEFDQDAVVHRVGVQQAFSLRQMPRSEWACDFLVGYTFSSYLADGSEYDRYVHDFHLGLGVPLINPAKPDEYLLLPDKELVFRFQANWEHASHWNGSRNDRDRDGRSDLITTLSFMASQTLLSDPDDGELVLHAIVNWTEADSNVTTRDLLHPFTYDKVIYGIQLVWSW